MVMEMEMEIGDGGWVRRRLQPSGGYGGYSPGSYGSYSTRYGGTYRRYRPIQITVSPLHNNTNLVM